LRSGFRGLPGGSSLAQLLAEHRRARNRKALPPYRLQQILTWADSHHFRSGHWPTAKDGPVVDAPGETWMAVDMALRWGGRGLRGGSSLPRLLARHRGVRNLHGLPPLSIEQILQWADAHQRRTGIWPTSYDGQVIDAPAETWGGISNALRSGLRGLPGSCSLAQLLAENRGVDLGHRRLRPLDEDAILAWADAFFQQQGRWPRSDDGPIPGTEGESWLSVHLALKVGRRGFARGSSLAHFLVGHGRGRNRKGLPPLSVPQVLAWARAHHARTGVWPRQRSGPIREAAGETWMAVHIALSLGRRGFPGGSSLVALLRDHGLG
jgi:hypothetical protein